ncbi:uncharacterized protein LOC143367496 isoform X2 [Andrena cerasifolii]|uniref:uncharacterized protein LOC143367496 isoform X2 n=1 Tax=Andrena cerasifolii TaxID=2819439 RepID=UPI0040376CF8
MIISILNHARIKNKAFLCRTSSAKDYLHMKHKNYQEDSSQICETFKLTTRNVRNPMFVVEYEYVLHEVRKEKYEIPVDTCTSESSAHISLSNFYVSQHINIHRRVEIYNLVKICICGQNINSIDTDLDLPNLRDFDISFNRLQELPRSSFMKNIEILNISFNNIKWINVEETLPALQDLDISWNCLINCLAVIETFKTFIPNMHKLSVHNNPFQDVLDPKLAEYLTYVCIPKLQFINHHACETLNLHQSYFPCAFSMCRLKQHSKLLYLKRNAITSGNQMTVVERRNIEHAKCIHVSQDFLIASAVLKRASKVQELCATCCLLTTLSLTRPLKHLTKLNLGSNFISISNAFTKENFPSLKYLDLTNNLIANLEPMKSFRTLQEFYCGNNNIGSITEIDNVKTWEMLYIIDLSSNPICNADALYKSFIIFHLSNVKCISGEYVQKSDVSEARHIFGNKLDKHVLNTMYSTDQLINITQLSLTDCSLSKVDLSAELLPQLESLDLSKNQITYLLSLHSFQHLHTLCLSYNCLETFGQSDGKGNVYTFPKLCTLFLDHNCIQSLMDINMKLPVIKHLFLHNNYLRNVNGINRCSTLESIVLDYNEIQILAVEDFLGSDNLKYLSIENNKLKSLVFVKELQKLEKLYAANNCLTDSNDVQYLSALTNLEELTLEGNPLYIEIGKDKMIAEDFEVKNAEVEEV